MSSLSPVFHYGCIHVPCENALHYCMHELEPLHFGSHSHVEQHSGTSDNGHSEERTTSLQRTNCMPPAENCMHSTYISTSEILTPLTSEQLKISLAHICDRARINQPYAAMYYRRECTEISAARPPRAKRVIRTNV